MQENGEEPLPEVIAQRADMTRENVEKLLEMAPKVSSLDAPAGEDGNVQQILENLQATQPYEELIRSELKHTLDRLLGLLPERQSLVLRLHFGLEDGVCYSLEDIGKRLEVSKQRAAQIEQQAIEKLQKLGAGFGLEEFLQ
jgi:RNA polymerase primary sigma factor